MPRQRLPILSILLILLLAAALRLIGTAWGAPDPLYSKAEIDAGQTNANSITHADEFLYAGHAYEMVAMRRPNPDFFEQPSLFIYLNAALDLISGDTAAYRVDPKIGARQVAPFTVYVMGRVLSALFGVLGVAFTYAAGRWLFGVKAGLLGALLLAVSFADVRHGHYGTTNVPAG